MLKKLRPGSIRLRNWNIVINHLTQTEHFIGFDIERQSGRHSTAILRFDLNTGLGITLSGSTYQVFDEPGMPHPRALFILNVIMSTKGLNLGEELEFKYPLDSLTQYH